MNSSRINCFSPDKFRYMKGHCALSLSLCLTFSIFHAIVKNDNDNRGRSSSRKSLKRTTAKIEIDQHAHATMSRSGVAGKHDKTGKRFTPVSRVVRGPDEDR